VAETCHAFVVAASAVGVSCDCATQKSQLTTLWLIACLGVITVIRPMLTISRRQLFTKDYFESLPHFASALRARGLMAGSGPIFPAGHKAVRRNVLMNRQNPVGCAPA
jgi:hypothetical protein